MATATTRDAEGLTTAKAELSGAAGIASWPAGAAPGNAVSIAEAIRYISDALAGTVGLASFPAAAAPANDVSLAEVIRQIYDQTGMGSVLVVEKTINQAAIVAAGVALTGASSGGALVLEDVIIQEAGAVDSTGHAAVVELYSDNVAGNGSFATFAQAKLPANGGCDFANATTKRKFVLESTKAVSVKATTEDVTSAGTITFYLIFRRAAAAATVAAA
jgi:hypothetical protein